MKKSSFFSLYLGLLLLILTTACSERNSKMSLKELQEDKSYISLKHYIEKYNSECPRACGDFGKIMSATLKDDVIKMQVLLYPEMEELSKLGKYKDEMKDLATTGMVDLIGDEGMNEIQRLGVSLKFEYKLNMADKSVLDITISPEDLAKKSNIVKDWEFYDQRLEKEMNMANLITPIPIDETTTMIHAGKKANIAYFSYEVDDKIADFEGAKENAYIFKQGFIEYLATNDPNTQKVLDLIKRANATIRLYYVAKYSKEEFHVDITPDELSSL